MINQKKPKWLRPVAIFAIIFGIATVLSGGRSLFTEAGNVAAGNYVSFVLWFNFFAGILYIIGGVGIFKDLPWAKLVAAAIAATTVLVFIFFGVHILWGGAYEARTMGAMILRSGFWVVVTVLLYRRAQYKHE